MYYGYVYPYSCSTSTICKIPEKRQHYIIPTHAQSCLRRDRTRSRIITQRVLPIGQPTHGQPHAPAYRKTVYVIRSAYFLSFYTPVQYYGVKYLRTGKTLSGDGIKVKKKHGFVEKRKSVGRDSTRAVAQCII